MSFTYDVVNSPQISYVRLLIPDTDASDPIFSDEEILAFYNIVGMVYQSSAFWSGTSFASQLPLPPLNCVRAASYALDALAGDKARLSSITRILDVELAPGKAAAALHAQAQAWRDIDDNSGAFAIIEQCGTLWSFEERWLKQMQRMQGVW